MQEPIETPFDPIKHTKNASLKKDQLASYSGLGKRLLLQILEREPETERGQYLFGAYLSHGVSSFSIAFIPLWIREIRAFVIFTEKGIVIAAQTTFYLIHKRPIQTTFIPVDTISMIKMTKPTFVTSMCKIDIATHDGSTLLQPKPKHFRAVMAKIVEWSAERSVITMVV